MSPASPSTDLVVVLPGILGSTLRQGDRMIWAPSAGVVLRAIATLGHYLDDATLPEGIGDDHPGDGVEPVALMPDLHAIPGFWTPVKGYDRLVDRLREIGFRDVQPDREAPPGNLLIVPYDWRLSNRYNGQRLTSIVEPALGRWRAQGGRYAQAQVSFVCHSMGGLVARWYIEKCGGAAHTRKLITLGTPTRGAAKALVQLVNGIAPSIGRLSEPLSTFTRRMPSTYQLLPDYACIDRGKDLLTLAEAGAPGLDGAMLTDASRFYEQLNTAEQARPGHAQMTYAIVGTAQNTCTTASFEDGGVIPRNSYGADELFGDATVPLVGATPQGLALDSNTIARVTEKHGNLQRNDAVLDMVREILLTPSLIPRGPGGRVETRVTVPELILAGQGLPVTVELPEGQRHGVRVTLTSEDGRSDTRTPPLRSGRASTTFTDLPPGGYTVDVSGAGPASPMAPVSSDLLVWDPAISAP